MNNARAMGARDFIPEPGMNLEQGLRSRFTDAEIKARREASEARALAVKVEACMRNCGVPKKYEHATLKDTLEVPPNSIKAYTGVVEAVQRLAADKGTLALLGKRGIGKTWIACGLVLDECRAGRPARRVHVMDYFDGIKETYSDKARSSEVSYEADFMRLRVLVIDELHERSDTPWEDRKLTRLIVKRHEADLATILITNDAEKAFAERIGDSVISRCFEDAGGILICKWANLRTQTPG